MQSRCTGDCGIVARNRSARPANPTFRCQASRLLCSIRVKECRASRRRTDTHATAADFGSTAREPNYESISFRQTSGSTASTSAVADAEDQEQTKGKLEEVKEFLKEELNSIFDGGVSIATLAVSKLRLANCLTCQNVQMQSVSRERYAANLRFQDPVVDYSSLDGFIFNVQALRTAFKAQLDLHDIKVNGPEEIRTR